MSLNPTAAEFTFSTESPASSGPSESAGKGKGRGNARSRGKGKGKGRGKGKGKGRIEAEGDAAPAEGTTTTTTTKTSSSAAAAEPRKKRTRGAPPRGGAASSSSSSSSSTTSTSTPLTPAETTTNDKSTRGKGRGGSARGGRQRVAAGGGGVVADTPTLTSSTAAAKTRVPAAAPSGKRRFDLSVLSQHSELAQRIAKDLVSNRYECMVCFDVVRASSRVWSCGKCFRVLHLHCLRKWCAGGHGDPSCPGCRDPLPAIPRSYTCFCGRETDPRPDHQSIPHSCGEPCLRERGAGSDCPHRCAMMCHPGSCAPCSVVKPPAPCACGKAVVSARCGDPAGGTCGDTCGRPLPCGAHTCGKPCHRGPCGGCAETQEVRCASGEHVGTVPCGTTVYECGERCGAMLGCGEHRCERGCHPPRKGNDSDCDNDNDNERGCGPCERAPGRARCLCGSRSEQEIIDDGTTTSSSSSSSTTTTTTSRLRESCLDPLPVCGRRVRHRCRCGAGDVEMECSDRARERPELLPGRGAEPLCTMVCDKLLSCGRHRCTRRCCPAARTNDPDIEFDAHMCPRECGKQLRGCEHRCTLPCHRGRCAPCPHGSNEPLFCDCGAESIPPPVACGTPQPVCLRPCQKSLPCGHPSPTHPCHPGECPPCTYLTTRTCLCGRTQRTNVPCRVATVTCGMPCDKLLEDACGDHHCLRQCHDGVCVTAEDMDAAERCYAETMAERSSGGASWDSPAATAAAAAKGTASAPGGGVETTAACTDGTRRSCGQRCGKPRDGTCGHACPDLCHPGRACDPRAPCAVTVPVTCPCRFLTEMIPCGEAGFVPPVGEPLPGGSGVQTEESRSIALATFFVRLACKPECAEHRRRRELEAAFGKRIMFPEQLVSLAREDPKFILEVERMLKDFVLPGTFRAAAAAAAVESGAVNAASGASGASGAPAESSPDVKLFEHLPPMSSVRRRAVHDLAAMYGLCTVSEGQGTDRHVVIVRPDTTLEGAEPVGVPKVTLSMFARSYSEGGAAGASARLSSESHPASGFVPKDRSYTGVLRFPDLPMGTGASAIILALAQFDKLSQQHHQQQQQLAAAAAAGAGGETPAASNPVPFMLSASSYELRWLDASNALAFFYESAPFKAAAAAVAAGNGTLAGLRVAVMDAGVTEAPRRTLRKAGGGTLASTASAVGKSNGQRNDDHDDDHHDHDDGHDGEQQEEKVTVMSATTTTTTNSPSSSASSDDAVHPEIAPTAPETDAAADDDVVEDWEMVDGDD